ncbi:uncharacterized protein LOC135126334 isoform X6 [Zophobas morio]|uniref:uncharacterized protein LOC135126334 isoform X6 n=1 Tax=Zophobas morio TaxID=2755281 RepID=UPI00308286A0
MLRKLNVIKIIISLLVTASFKYSHCEDVFFLAKNYDSSRYSYFHRNYNYYHRNYNYEQYRFYCITNSSRALSWIIEDTTSSVDLQQGSTFVPVAKELWKVDCNETRKYGWPCRQSVADEIITDRRWENIQIHKTDYAAVSSKSELQFLKILETESANFKVPLSIRTSQEAHIFLCEGETVLSNCYWFILQGFSGTKSVFRKCLVNTIPTKINVAVESPCDTNKVSKEQESESSKFLTNTTWQHFMLTKNKNKISLSKQDGQEILSYTDNEETYKIRDILIHSKRTVGLWKIHKDKYFTINQTKRTDFERTLSPVNGKICITTFVRMCKTCKIKFVITNGDNDKQVLEQQIYEKMPKWTEITFVKRATEAKNVKFAIITMDEFISHSFWDIQEIQQCGENGLRMIHLNVMANCQLLSSDNKVISLDTVVTASSADKYTKCAENTISTHCVPCNLFHNKDCGQLKVCENNQNGLFCSCSAGYKTDYQKINCQIRCNFGTYGYHCSKTCSTYCVGCDPVDGTCRFCINYYKGPKCTMAPPPFFKNTLKTHIEYTKAEILVDNFELGGTPDNTSSHYEYTIQYKEANSRKWTLHTDSAYAGMRHIFKIENLKPGVEYYVRSIIKKYVANYSDSIPKTDFVTKCDVVKSEDFEVEATNTSTYLTVKKDKQFISCKLKSSETNIEIQPKIPDFSYYLEDLTLDIAYLTVKRDKKFEICESKSSETNIAVQSHIQYVSCDFDGMTLNISGLRPFENFTLRIINKNIVVEVRFRTTEGVPDKVTNMIARATSDSKIDVKWSAPPNLYGNFQDFVVSYKIIKYLACDAAPTNLEETTKTSTKPSITLSNLNPYTLYSISVKARNTKLSGLEETVEQNTPQSATIRDQEIPKASLKKTNSRSVEIEFSGVSCSNLGGPLQVVTTAICLTDWCKHQSVSNSFTYPQHKTLTLSGLAPFTNYQLKLGFHRQPSSKFSTYGNFETKTEAPYCVNNLSVYSKNTHSISVRWRPPNPPTGILKLYQIKLFEPDKNINVTNSSCFLWPEYQCYTLENLVENMNYSVQLSAKNKEPDNFGQTSLVKAITKIEPSEKPLDVMVKWTLENDLDIRWKHPVVANGDIQYFKIKMLPWSSFENGKIDTTLDIFGGHYKSTYQKIVKSQSILSSTKYKILVHAYNGLDGKEVNITEMSPPEIPLLETDPTVVNVSTNTITLQVCTIKNFKSWNTYKLFLLVSDNSSHYDSNPPELQSFERNFGISLSVFRVIYECSNFTTAKQFVIGQSGNVSSNCKQDSAMFLTTRTFYNVTVMLVSTYQNKSSYKLYSTSALTSSVSPNTSDGSSNSVSPNTSDGSSNTSGEFPNTWDLRFLVLLLLLLVPIIYTYRLYKKKILAASGQDVGNRNLTSSVELRLNVAGLDHLQSKPITNRKFNNYVKTNLENKKLAAQHNAILQNTAAEYEEIGEKTYLERIDLHFTTGHRIPEVYAICDVPKDFDRFWKLAWNENIEHIVLLDDVHWNQTRKNYWPKFGLSLDIKHILVECIHEEIFTDHEYRTFRLTYQDKIRVYHTQRSRFCCVM